MRFRNITNPTISGPGTGYTGIAARDVTLYTFMVKRYHQCQKLRLTSWLQLGVTDPPYGKRWRLYILPQFLSNLTRPITFYGGGGGSEIRPCNSNIAYPLFKVYKTFLCVFMINFMVFMR